jgi:hypothetical protein
MKGILSNENMSRKYESMSCFINLPFSFFTKVTGCKTFIFFITCTAFFLTNTTSLFSQNPNWMPPNGGAYAYNANVIGKVLYNATASNHMNDRIAFFVNNQIRGLSTPVQVGSNVIHFVTVYANQTTEVMEVKIYHSADNLVYNVVAPFSFVANNIYGSINQPMKFDVFAQNNSPLFVNPIPPQQTIQGLAFNQINLQNFLVQPDPYPVDWTYTPDTNLNVSITNGILSVTAIPTFSGQTSLTVRATENGPFPPPQQFAERTIIFNVTSAYDGPLWNPIPDQGIVKGDTFQNADLNEYEFQYGGPYVAYRYEPVLSAKIPPVSPPNWIQPDTFVNSMLLTVQVNYTPYHQFIHPNDILAAFINNQLRGVASVHPTTGLFNLSLGSDRSSGEIIKLKLYSADMQEIISLRDSFIFVSAGIMGTPADPVVMDFTPVLPEIDSSGIASFLIRDTSFTGEVTYEFTAYDSLYTDYLYDQTITKLCIVYDINDLDTFYRDADGDGFGNPAISITSCRIPEEGYVINNLDCNDSDPSTIEFVFTVAIAESSVLPNDGHICSGISTEIDIIGGMTYLWNNGATTSAIIVNPDTTTHFQVTVTSVEGCMRDTIITVTVETNVITSNQNSGPGSIRSVLECIIENGDVYFDQPMIDHSLITSPLTVNKNVRLIGLSPVMRPYISADLGANNSNIQISNGKTLTFKDIDLRMTNQTGNMPYFAGTGQVFITGITEVMED